MCRRSPRTAGRRAARARAAPRMSAATPAPARATARSCPTAPTTPCAAVSWSGVNSIEQRTRRAPSRGNRRARPATTAAAPHSSSSLPPKLALLENRITQPGDAEQQRQRLAPGRLLLAEQDREAEQKHRVHRHVDDAGNAGRHEQHAPVEQRLGRRRFTSVPVTMRRSARPPPNVSRSSADRDHQHGRHQNVARGAEEHGGTAPRPALVAIQVTPQITDISRNRR